MITARCRTDQQDSNVHPRRGPARQRTAEAHLPPVDGVIQGETHPLAYVERRRRRGASDLDRSLGRDGRRLRSPGQDAKTRRLRMLVEAGVTAVWMLLLLMVCVLIVTMVAVAGVIIAAAADALVVVSLPLARPLVLLGAVAAGPAAEPDATDWEEEGGRFGADEDLMTLVGTVAHSFTHCCTLHKV